MKKTTKEQKMDANQELERFKAASSSLVQRAKKDREFARELMRDTGYFAVMPQAAQSTTSRKTSRNTTTAATAHKVAAAPRQANSAKAGKRQSATIKKSR